MSQTIDLDDIQFGVGNTTATNDFLDQSIDNTAMFASPKAKRGSSFVPGISQSPVVAGPLKLPEIGDK